MKLMSLIGIIWCSLSLVFVIDFARIDYDAAIGWALLGLFYAVPYSIAMHIKLSKKEGN